jgi:hypothetical protein
MLVFSLRDNEFATRVVFLGVEKGWDHAFMKEQLWSESCKILQLLQSVFGMNKPEIGDVNEKGVATGIGGI